MKINWSNINQKVKARIEQPDMVNRIDAIVDSMMLSGEHEINHNGKVIPTPAGGASQFIQVLYMTISALRSPDGYSPGLLGPAAIEALSEIDYTKTYKESRGYYRVGVFFVDNLYRPSLYPEKYDGIDNIAALLNNGFGQTRGSVYGLWHSKQITGLRRRIGAGFVQLAKDDFMGNYGVRYGVETINIDEIYE